MHVESVGATPEGREVLLVRLGDEPGPVVELLTLGATVHRLHVTGGDGVRRNIVLGHRTVAERLSSPHYLGGTIGRVANRIATGLFALDGHPFAVPTHDRGNALHGGPVGFDKKVWELLDADDGTAAMRLVSPDGDMGFPGTLTAHVTYRVASDTITVQMSGTCDAPTVVSMTNHAYFNLDGEGAGTVDAHRLTVPADRFTAVDQDDIPSGAMTSVDGTILDFRAATELGPRLRSADPLLEYPRGVDHNLIMTSVAEDGVRRVASLDSDASGTRLEVWSDQPCLQVYTANKLDGSVIGTAGVRYRQGDGIALEPQAHPDAVNHPEFPSIDLLPTQTYRATLAWRLTPFSPSLPAGAR